MSDTNVETLRELFERGANIKFTSEDDKGDLLYFDGDSVFYSSTKMDAEIEICILEYPFSCFEVE
jgi:hypothetical protein